VGHWNPHQIHFLQDQPQGFNRALEHRRKGEVKAVASLLQQTARFNGFVDAFFAQGNIRPTAEAVLLVPQALAVSEQNKLFHLRVYLVQEIDVKYIL
jgi:hypothetical protein